MDKFRAKLVIFLLRMLSKLSLKGAHRLGRFVGRMFWMSDTKLAHITKRNIELVYPDLDEEQQQALVKSSLLETGMLFSEMGVMWEWPVEKTLGLIKEVEGKEHFDAIVEGNKGVIIVAPHHGNWELVGLYTSSLKPMASLYRPPKIKPLENYMSQVRGRIGSELVPTNKRGVIRLFAVLREQGMVGILPDQVPGGDGGIYVPFMGVQAKTIKLLSRLLHKTDSEAVCVYAVRLPNSEGFKMVFKPVDQDIYSEDIETSVSALNRSIEACIEDHPEQYQWEYKRFKDYRQGVRYPYG